METKEDVKDAEEIYPRDPKEAANGSKLAEEINPAVWKATVVETKEDVKEADDTYPEEPSPPTVLMRFKFVLTICDEK